MTTEPFNVPLFFRALRFSAARHRDDKRKDPRGSPYINHPIAVAAELADSGVTDSEVLAAALLHDTLEDTWATPEEVESEFGSSVLRLVEAVTDDPDLSGPEKKRRQAERAPHLPPGARLIKLADKICNVRDVVGSPAAGWSRQRRRDYLDSAEQVAIGCRGVNEALDARWLEVSDSARAHLSSVRDAPAGLRVIAIDWSGALSGERKKIWLAEVQDGELLRLEAGRSRDDVVEHVIQEARREPKLIVGLDFAFSFPEWFLQSQGVRDVRSLWARVEQEGERWLAECPGPFWGKPGRKKPGSDGLPEEWRRTDRETPAVGSSRPKSVFQVGGAGAVGTGSIRGMPALKRLVEAGLSVWPFDPVRLPAVIEIYPRVLTGSVVKTRPAARDDYLAREYPGLPEPLRVTAASSDDAFDAAVSAFAMWEHVEELMSLSQSEDRQVLREGWIWVPGGDR